MLGKIHVFRDRSYICISWFSRCKHSDYPNDLCVNFRYLDLHEYKSNTPAFKVSKARSAKARSECFPLCPWAAASFNIHLHFLFLCVWRKWNRFERFVLGYMLFEEEILLCKHQYVKKACNPVNVMKIHRGPRTSVRSRKKLLGAV